MPNSLAQAGEFTCPQCHRPFAADVWLIVDAGERPDLVQRIRAGDLHAVVNLLCKRDEI